MSTIAYPHISPARRSIWLLAPLAAVLAVGGYWGVSRYRNGGSVVDAVGSTVVVTPMDFEIKVSKDGEVQAVNAIEIICLVEGGTTIQTLVKEGTHAKKGDVLITLDSSAIRQRMEDTMLEVQQAEADLVTARELREIQVSQNSANLQAAEVTLQAAQIDLKAYIEGTYPQSLADAKTLVETTGINLKTKEDDLSNVRVLETKGFVTPNDVKKSEQDVATARNEQQKAQTALKVLADYTNQKDLTAKNSSVSLAEQALVRVKRENASNLSQRDAAVLSKDQQYGLKKRRQEKLQEQIDACTITAPTDGLVVYSTSGDRNAQSALTEGAQVRERQSLLRLPDTSSMKATIRVGEAQVQRLREGMRARIFVNGSTQASLGATLANISVLADSSQRFWNPDLREYPVDLLLDDTPVGLKPGMGCRAEIMVDRSPGTLALPLSAIYSAGQDTYAFVRRGDMNTPLKIKIGRTNETHAEVMEGLSAGDEALVLQIGQGQELLDRAGIKVTPTSRPSDDQKGNGGANRRRGNRGPGQGGPGAPDGAPAAPTDANTPSANPTANPSGEPRGDGAPGGQPRPRRQGQGGGDGSSATPPTSGK